MVIHILINCYWGSGMSGGDRRVLELMRHWSGTNHIFVYTTRKFGQLMQKEGICVEQVIYTDSSCHDDDNIITAYFKRTVECYRMLKKMVKQGDIIYSPTDILPDVLPAYMVRKGCRWSVVTHHIYEVFYRRPGKLITNFLSCMQQKYALHLAKVYANAIITPSPCVYEALSKKNARYELYRTGNGVDFELINSIDAAQFSYDACILCRLNYSKGILELPDIWEKVLQEKPDARLAVMGGGPDNIVSELKQAFSDKKLEGSVDILGYVTAEKAYAILKAAKVFLFTSHEEGWGIALAEALACETPVVAYDLPVFGPLFPVGTTLCSFKNTEEMALSVLKLLKNAEFRKSEGKLGKEYVCSHYALDALAKQELSIVLGCH